MRKGMRKATSFSRWSLLMGVACGLAMLPVANRSARAEIITYTIDVNGVPIVPPLAPPATGTSTASSYSTAELTTLNSELSFAGSAYTFQSISGSSNYPGASTGGVLSLVGIVTLSNPAGSTSLTLKETETGFLSPSSLPGTLASSSSVTFNNAGNAGTGNSQTTDSSFNAITTPPITLASSSSTGPNSPNPGLPETAPIVFTTPYALDNSISFSLSTPGAVDNFTLSAKATTIPEPASVVTMLIGLPLPLVGLAWLRRRKAGIANS